MQMNAFLVLGIEGYIGKKDRVSELIYMVFMVLLGETDINQSHVKTEEVMSDL